MLDNFVDMPLAVVKGDTIKFNFVIEGIGEEEEFDEIAFTIKKNYDDQNPVVSSTLTNGKIERVSYDVESQKALYVCTGDSDETKNLDADSFGFYDIRALYQGTTILTFLRGRIKILEQVTTNLVNS